VCHEVGAVREESLPGSIDRCCRQVPFPLSSRSGWCRRAP